MDKCVTPVAVVPVLERCLQTHHAVSRILAEATSLSRATPQILESLCAAGGWDLALFWCADPQDGQLRCTDAWQHPDLIAPEINVFAGRGARSAGLAGALHGNPFGISAPQSSFPGEALHPTAKAPIRWGEQELGLIECFSRETAAPDPLCSLTLETVAAQLALFLRRLRVEEELRASEAARTAILETTFDCIITTDPHGLVLHWNPAAERTFGYAPAAALGRELTSLILLPAEHPTGSPDALGPLAAPDGAPPGRPRRLVLHRADGTRFPAECALSRIAPRGEARFTVCIRECSPQTSPGLLPAHHRPPQNGGGEPDENPTRSRETAERRAAEAALRRSEERLRFMAESMPQKIFTAKPDGQIDYFNRQWIEFAGFDFNEITGWGWARFLHPDDVAEHVWSWQHALATGVPFQLEHRFRRRDGAYRWHLTRAQPMRNRQGRVLMWVGSHTDIDDQKQVQERYRQLNRTLTSVLASIPDVVVVTDGSGRIKFSNPAARRFARALALDQALPAPIQAELDQVLQTGEHRLPNTLNTLHRFRLGTERFFLSRMVAMKADDHRVFGIVILLQDVTEMRLLDEVKTNLVSTVSHELKTPITSLRTALHLLRRQSDTELTHRQQELLTLAEADSERLVRTINTLLDLARFEHHTHGLILEPVPAPELVHAAVDEVRAAAAAAALELTIELAESLPRVSVDKDRIRHVLTNLLTNAIKYSPPHSRIQVRVRRQHDGVCFSVCDDGPGIPQEYQSRIFDKFFRAPGTAAKGIGLGLSIARDCVFAHNGHIGVVSEPGQGSEFFFILPAAEATP